METFVERYQILYEKDPSSKVFAPLAEAYRRMGLLDKAIEIAEYGVGLHPNFASGRVALGKCYHDKKSYDKAAIHLKAAADLSPENILAQQLLADCYMQLGQNEKALSAYKMVLFLTPQDKKMAETVAKLEKEVFGSFTKSGGGKTAVHLGRKQAEEEPEEEYKMKPLRKAAPQTQVATAIAKAGVSLERELALFDAWYHRGDWAKAEQVLQTIPPQSQDDPEVVARRTKLNELTSTGFDTLDVDWISPLENDRKSKKIQLLEKFLSRIDSNKRP